MRGGREVKRERERGDEKGMRGGERSNKDSAPLASHLWNGKKEGSGRKRRGKERRMDKTTVKGKVDVTGDAWRGCMEEEESTGKKSEPGTRCAQDQPLPR